MFDRLRRYDVQAAYAAILAIASLLPCAVAALLVLRNYRNDIGQIVYGSQGIFVPALLAALGLSVALGAPGFLLGLNSAGRRRNETPGRSWIGFFVGGAVLTINAILLLAFYMLKLQQPI